NLPFDQQRPMIAADGSGGVFVAWDDDRAFLGDVAHSAQLTRFLSNGQLAPAFASLPNGLDVTAGGKVFLWDVLADGANGVYVTWNSDQGSAPDLNVYLARITGDAVPQVNWPIRLQVTPIANGRYTRNVIDQQFGNVTVAWGYTGQSQVSEVWV